MALKLRLKPNERIVVNGCVITNGDRRTTLTVSSFGQVMRARHIMQPEDAKSPVDRLYLAIQSMLIDNGTVDTAIRHVNRQAARLIAQASDTGLRRRLMTVMDHVHTGDFYRGLMELRPLLTSSRSAVASPVRAEGGA